MNRHSWCGIVLLLRVHVPKSYLLAYWDKSVNAQKADSVSICVSKKYAIVRQILAPIFLHTAHTVLDLSDVRTGSMFLDPLAIDLFAEIRFQ